MGTKREKLTGIRLQLMLFGCMLMFVAFWSVPRHSTGVERHTPTQVVRDLVQAIGSIKTAENSTLSAADEANNTTATAMAHAIFDIPGVSKRVLGRHWRKRTPAEQQAFIDLLRGLLAKVAYPKSAEFFRDLDVSVIDARATGERAVVRTTVSDPKEGLISVDYRLRQQDSSWRVRDIVLDDVSLSLNLRSQCNLIITKHSYEELLLRMRRKLTE